MVCNSCAYTLTVREVYKSPALDLVGWFTLGSSSGPQPRHLPIHRQLQAGYNESVALLLFHADAVIQGSATGGKLPLSLYESVWTSDGSSSMDTGSAGQAKTIKFQELSYSVETGEAEMISVDFVARGGGNATAVDGTKKPAQSQDQGATDITGKGKAKEGDAHVNGTAADDELYLSPEDDESTLIYSSRTLHSTRTHHFGSDLLPDSQTQRNENASPAHSPDPSLLLLAPAFLSH